jgi:hypothetical protein
MAENKSASAGAPGEPHRTAEDTLSASPDLIAAADPSLGEDRALALLKRVDFPADALARLSKNASAMKSRRVKLALVQHPRTPHHVSVPMLRHLFTFELMQVALTPVVAADIKRNAEDALVTRLETISPGERLSLAYRASGRVAAELLGDSEPRIIHAALGNPRLTEAEIIRALMRPNSPAQLAESVCAHAKWSLRREVRVALLRNENAPLAHVLEFAQSLSVRQLREVLHNGRLPERTKSYLLQELSKKSADSSAGALN